MKNFIVRGILIGGSLGVLSALAGISDNMPRAFFLGSLGGILAGITLGILQNKKKQKHLHLKTKKPPSDTTK